MATTRKRAVSKKRGEEKEPVMDVPSEEMMVTENTEERTEAMGIEPPKEGDNFRIIMEFLKEQQKNTEDLMKRNAEESKRNAEEIKKNIAEEIKKNIEEVMERIETYQVEVNQHVLELHEKVNQTQIELQQTREDLQLQIIRSEEGMRSQIVEVRKENREEIEHNTIRIEENKTELTRIHGIAMNNRISIDEIRFQELSQLRDELEVIRYRPVMYSDKIQGELKDTISFRKHKRNPMEFLARLDEYLERLHIQSWNMIRSVIDEQFKDINDHWWTATRHELNDYEEFKTVFKMKYWSESTQNIVRDDICNGKYETGRGSTPTAYFLGKVCLARNLEPKIPEESLVIKLAYHYEEGIPRARLCGQIKTIQAMAALLENYEHESYYRQNQRTKDHGNYQTKCVRLGNNNNYNHRENNRNYYREGNRNQQQRLNNESPNTPRFDNNNRTPQRNDNNNNNYNNYDSNRRYNNNNNYNNQNNRRYQPRVNFIQGGRTFRTRRHSQNDEEGYFERQRPIRSNHTRSRSQEDRREVSPFNVNHLINEQRHNYERQETMTDVNRTHDSLNESRQ